MSSTINTIRVRAAELAKRLADAETSVRLMREEHEELLAALKVIDRFADEDELAVGVEPDLESRRVDPPTEETAAPPPGKPVGTPTIPDMILDVLSEANLRGSPAMAPKEITYSIRHRWWPQARSASVGSIAWRMASEGRLAKEGGRYSIPPPPSGELFERSAPLTSASSNEESK